MALINTTYQPPKTPLAQLGATQQNPLRAQSGFDMNKALIKQGQPGFQTSAAPITSGNFKVGTADQFSGGTGVGVNQIQNAGANNTGILTYPELNKNLTNTGVINTGTTGTGTNTQTNTGSTTNTMQAGTSGVNTTTGTQSTVPTYAGIVGNLSQFDPAKTQAYQQAQTYLQQKTDELKKLDQDYAGQTANIEGTPGYLSLASGQQGLLDRKYLAARNAAQGAVSQAQQQVGQALTATGQQQGALTSAAGFAAPQTANALGTFNPVTGQYNQYGGAQGGGAATAGGVQTQIQQGADVQQMTGTLNQARSLVGNITDVMNKANINPGNGVALPATWVNGAIQWIENQKGDPQYQNFANLINEIAGRYAGILNQAGGTPTNQTQLSHSIINGLAGGQSIQQVISALDKNATDSINALNQAAKGNAVINPPQQTNASGSSIYNW